MLKYPCLVLDHDDTVVQSEATVNYPCFVDFLAKIRPGETITLHQYVEMCGSIGFIEMCRQIYRMTDAELDMEYAAWKDYTATHIPAPYPGIRALLRKYKAHGGKIYVVSQSTDAKILRDYRLHFELEPDGVYGWDHPQEQRKPSPFALFDIMEKTGLAPGQILVVDDMPPAREMADAAGMKMAFAGWGKQDYPKIREQMQKISDFSFLSLEQFAEFLFS